MESVNGLHHITAIAGPAQENLDFYAGVLGMRLVKKSVNQDDPGTYHLFYADAEGRRGGSPGRPAERRELGGQAVRAAEKLVSDFGIATECGFGRRPREQDIRELLHLHAQITEL